MRNPTRIQNGVILTIIDLCFFVSADLAWVQEIDD